VASGVRHAYHLAVVEIDFAGIGKSRATVMNELREKGIGTQVHYIPIPLMPYYKDSACMAEIPNSLDYYRKALSIPCFPQLSDEDVERVCQSIKEVIA
jgi:dTDP-4-amino-4,6-dideoxygalactose transaminase